MDIISYFSRSILILLVFTLVYLLAYRNDSHFTMHRLFLLMGLLSSLILPLVEINYTVLVDPIQANKIFKEVDTPVAVASVNYENASPSFNWLTLISWIYLTGVVVFGLRIIWSIIRIIKLMHKSKKKKINGATFFIGKQVKEPFSFGSYIFIDNESYFNNAPSEIIEHEKIHLKQKHWFDVLLSEIFISIQWFNPMAWYYGRLVKQNLEFIADQGVLKQGFSIENYIQTIICETMGAEASVLANHFRYSQNKKRLKMMKNVRKSKWLQLKLLLTLPIMGSFMWAFSQPEYQLAQVVNTPAELVNIVDGEKTTIKGKVSVTDTINIKDIETAKIKKEVIAKRMPGVNIVIKGKPSGTISNKDGNFSIEALEGDILAFSCVGYKTEERMVEDGMVLDIVLKPTSYELDPSPFRKKYKGKAFLPPPPPPPPAPAVNEKKKLPPPPPPPPKKQKNESTQASAKGDEEEVFFIVEQLPEYKSGMDTYFALLYSSIKKAKQQQKLSGVVKVKFAVNAKGKVEKVVAIGNEGKEARIAEKIVADLGNWQPGKQRGKPILCTLIVPVEFD